MLQENLDATLLRDVLDYLSCPQKPPTPRYLNRLIYAYIRKVPWESVSRIVKRHTTSETKDCPRLPQEFWKEALEHGFGGTCFESSLAFYSLLTTLGYEGYLTTNDMGDSIGCHAAIVVLLNGKKYLVDVTIPIHSAVPVNPAKSTRRHTLFQDYTIRPVWGNRYEVERSHHPHRNVFTLVDVPVSLLDYRIILEKDYEETGFFLKSVVMVKFINGKTWRFFSDQQPYRLETFDKVGKNEILLDSNTLPRSLARVFQMPRDQISTALSWTQQPLSEYRNHSRDQIVIMEMVHNETIES